MTYRLNVSDFTAAREWVKRALEGGAEPWLIYQNDGGRGIHVSDYEASNAGILPIPGGRAFAAIARVLEEIGRVHRASA